MNVGDHISRAVRRFPNAIAVISGDFQLRYQELDQRCERLANALLAAGLEKGDRVATLMDNSHHCIEIDFALAKAGLVRVSLNPRSTAKDTVYILKDSEASTLIFGGSHSQMASAVRPEVPMVKLWIGIDEHDSAEQLDGGQDFESFLMRGEPGAPGVEIDPEDLYCLFYTSGTTGLPKGVMLSHRSILNVSYNLIMEVGPVSPGEKILLMQPMSHGAGFFVLPWLMRGGTAVIMRHFDAEETLRLAKELEIETIKLIPTMLQRILLTEAADTPTLPKLRQIIYGASPMPTEVLRRSLERFGPKLVQIYGQSEAPVTLSVLPIVDHAGPDQERLTSAGVPWPTVEIRIIDDNGEELPRGQAGEVVLRAPQVMSGYWKRPDLTADTIRSGWLHTKDFGRLDESGYLYLLGRKDEMIISGGYNIAPREIEDALYLHPSVQEAAVIGEPDKEWGSAVVAYVSVSDGALESEINEFARSHLGFKRPKKLYRVRELPKNSNGKIQKTALNPDIAIVWESSTS